MLTRTKPAPTESASKPKVNWVRSGNEIKKSFSGSNMDDEGSLLSPAVEDYWATETVVGRDHALVVSSKGYQNVTLRSRLFQDAHSKLHVT